MKITLLEKLSEEELKEREPNKVALNYNSFALWYLAKFFEVSHPFSMFINENGEFDNGILSAKLMDLQDRTNILRAGICGDLKREVSTEETLELLDSVGGFSATNLGELANALLESIAPKELLELTKDLPENKVESKKKVGRSGGVKKS